MRSVTLSLLLLFFDVMFVSMTSLRLSFTAVNVLQKVNNTELTQFALSFTSLDQTGPCGFQGDVLFIMDSSAEVSRGDYAKEKDFVESLASFLRLSPGGTRAALLTYGYTATLVANYDSYDTLTPFKNAVQRAPYISGTIIVIFFNIYSVLKSCAFALFVICRK